jgi:hypothetical protein
MFKKKLQITALLLSAICSQVEAETISTDGNWHQFDIDTDISNTWIDLDNNPLTFDFTLTGTAILDVVDAGFGGDRFTVIPFIIEQVIGYQERIGNNTYPTSVGVNFDQAYSDVNYSRYSYTLLPGSYTLVSGELVESALDDNGSPINATVGAIRLTSVPLPAAAWLYLTGSALMGFASRRRQANA